MVKHFKLYVRGMSWPHHQAPGPLSVAPIVLSSVWNLHRGSRGRQARAGTVCVFSSEAVGEGEAKGHHSPAGTGTPHTHVAMCPSWPRDVRAGRVSLAPWGYPWAPAVNMSPREKTL